MMRSLISLVAKLAVVLYQLSACRRRPIYSLNDSCCCHETRKLPLSDVISKRRLRAYAHIDCLICRKFFWMVLVQHRQIYFSLLAYDINQSSLIETVVKLNPAICLCPVITQLSKLLFLITAKTPDTAVMTYSP